MHSARLLDKLIGSRFVLLRIALSSPATAHIVSKRRKRPYADWNSCLLL